MTVEVRPLGDKCNIKCQYCYQEGIRTAGNVPDGYDVEAMLRALDEIGEPFSLFGGEIMMVRRADLKRLLAFGLQRYGGTKLQTNATLIEEADLALFRDYAVRVGISIDGPGGLNDARWAGTFVATRRATARTEAVIETLCHEGTPPTIIITLHRLNTQGACLDILLEWLGFLDGLGVRRARAHFLEIDNESVAADLRLTPAENLAVLRRLRAVEPRFSGLRFDIFDEMANMLRGQDQLASCQFHACDSYSTRAVVGVEGHGRLSNCGRTNKDGVSYQRTPTESFDRQIALYHTPQADGGCAGCRFFLMCKGNCPGTAIDGDWRLRSSDCPVWFALFEDIEHDMRAAGEEPLSLSPRRPAIEDRMLEAWSLGENPLLVSLTSDVSVP
jgi:uncharacterized protein